MNDDGQMPDAYERLLGSLDGLPDAMTTKPATVRTTTPLLGITETWIVQTIRHADSGGDTIFLERGGRDGLIRLAIPAKVAGVIARQRDALTTRSRKKAARAAVETRREKGIVPFQRKAAPHVLRRIRDD
jgi:hypothetical protein